MPICVVQENAGNVAKGVPQPVQLAQRDDQVAGLAGLAQQREAVHFVGHLLDQLGQVAGLLLAQALEGIGQVPAQAMPPT